MKATNLQYGWIDISSNLGKSQDGDLAVSTDIEAVKNSLTNILSTLQGQRRMLPNFALPIYKLLFEPIDEITASKIGTYILYGVETWDTRVLVDNVNVDADEDNNQYNVRLRFRIRPNSNQYSLDYVIRRI